MCRQVVSHFRKRCLPTGTVEDAAGKSADSRGTLDHAPPQREMQLPYQLRVSSDNNGLRVNRYGPRAKDVKSTDTKQGWRRANFGEFRMSVPGY
jgi:hypothetical protein